MKDDHFSEELSDEQRVCEAQRLVERINKLSRQSPGDNFSEFGIAEPMAGRHCPLCALKCTCLGPSCLGYTGLHKVYNRELLSFTSYV